MLCCFPLAISVIRFTIILCLKWNASIEMSSVRFERGKMCILNGPTLSNVSMSLWMRLCALNWVESFWSEEKCKKKHSANDTSNCFFQIDIHLVFIKPFYLSHFVSNDLSPATNSNRNRKSYCKWFDQLTG